MHFHEFFHISVPLTIGTRNRYHDNESTLTMIFHDEVQSERAKKIIESLKSNTDQLELVKSRKLTLDVRVTFKIIFGKAISKNSILGFGC